jgi:hypothetical protein
MHGHTRTSTDGHTPARQATRARARTWWVIGVALVLMVGGGQAQLGSFSLGGFGNRPATVISAPAYIGFTNEFATGFSTARSHETGPFTVATTKTLTAIGFYGSASIANMEVSAAVYLQTTANRRGTLIATNTAVTITQTSVGRYLIAMPNVTLTPGNSYWLSVWGKTTLNTRRSAMTGYTATATEATTLWPAWTSSNTPNNIYTDTALGLFGVVE